jgi:hypothetical protein
MARRADKAFDKDAEVLVADFLATIPRLPLPTRRSPLPDDLAARREIASRMDRFREQLGSIDASVDELIRNDRDAH